MRDVSVVVPIFNHERFVAEALESALDQTSPPGEVIAVDDGSTDATPEILSGFADRVTVLRKENGGCPSALNLGIRSARGAWIAWLASDDRWLPEKLEHQASRLASYPHAVVATTDDYLIDASGARLARRRMPAAKTLFGQRAALLRRCFVDGSTVLVRRAAVEQAGFFAEADVFAHDYRMWLALAREHPFTHVPEPLVESRIHPGQVSRRAEDAARASKRASLEAARTYPPVSAALGVGLRILDEAALLPLRALGSERVRKGPVDPLALVPWTADAGRGHRLRTGLRAWGETWRILVRPSAGHAGGARP